MNRHQTSSLILITLALFFLTACTPSSPPETVATTPQPTVQATAEVATPGVRRLQAGELELVADIDAIPASLVFWFAWSDLYPDTDLYTLD